ncbi:divergent polysaccharide deacetylase family protein [Psychromarinibacter sp. C21-152]|uniref:Divergent polysaccharide deacetylase family protein n=1 Tax=Psychromarinibacter sediminicola TaxID=3033385 RepID=A0AAE3T7B6_9RHOB|nr:divergent polysaccharide deacteylase family protein [Psychromarinibacter sediminicola]MDF0599483.1 divergent polysaccharide deacetylase family protein [Psychromarinibacter sediminicola]
MRGFLSGAVLGAVISGVGMTAGSYMAGPVMLSGPAPEAEVAAPPGAEVAEGRPDTAPEVPAAETAPAESDAPEAPTPEMAAPPDPETAPAGTPDADTDAEAEMSSPDSPDASDVTLSEPEDTVQPTPEAAPPTEPEAEAPPRVTAPEAPTDGPAAPDPVATAEAPPATPAPESVAETDGARPDLPAPEDDTAGAEPAGADAPEEVTAEVSTPAPTAPDGEGAPETPGAETAGGPEGARPELAAPDGETAGAEPARVPDAPGEVTAEVSTPAPTAPNGDAAPEAPAPETAGLAGEARPELAEPDDGPTGPDGTAPADPDAPAGVAAEVTAPDPTAPDRDSAPETPASETTDTADETRPDLPAPAPEADAPRIAESEPPEAPTPPPSDTEGPGIGVPVSGLGDLAPEVETGRLPSIGDESDAEASAPDDAETAAAADGPALTAYATPFETVPGNPLMSVVLLDPGPERRDPAALDGFPVPLTIGLDPTLPGAAEAMAAYRAAGHEVAVLAPLPEGAAPADVEVAFQTFLDAVPEAVAVLDTPAARLQANRPRAAQVSAILSETGHGLITYERGLNSGLQVADSRGVPATAVFRAFDEGDTQVGAMKRLLDVGAFRAAQEGAVVMVGELRPDTITALTEWVLGTRAATVTLAPASALLQSLP